MQDRIYNMNDMICPDDPQSRTYRQINQAKKHNYSKGQLVEIESGARLFIVHLTRDCDASPLYYLSADRDDIVEQHKGFSNPGGSGGWPEGSFIPVEIQPMYERLSWISVENKLPEIGKTVTVFDTSHRGRVVHGIKYYHKDLESVWCKPKSFCLKHITHWLELSDPWRRNEGN